MFRKYLFLFFIGVFISMPVYGGIIIGDGYSPKDNTIPAGRECIPDKTVCTANSSCYENLECLQNPNIKDCYRCNCDNGFDNVNGILMMIGKP